MEMKNILPDFFKNAFGLNEEPEQSCKRLIVMRHGNEMDHAKLRQQVGHSAAEYNRVFPDLPIEAIFHSPIKRTEDTANALSESMSPEDSTPPLMEKQEWLKDDAQKTFSDDDFIACIQGLNDDLNTVCLVTHATTGPAIIKQISDVDRNEVLFTVCDHAGMLVLDIPSDTWKDAGVKQAEIALGINQEHTLRQEDIQPALQNFMAGLN